MKTEIIHVAVEKETKAKLLRLASKNNAPISFVIRLALRDYLARNR